MHPRVLDTANLLTARLILPEYKDDRPVLQTAFMQDVLSRAIAVPGIQAVGLLPMLWPVRRALAVDPLTALRHE